MTGDGWRAELAARTFLRSRLLPYQVDELDRIGDQLDDTHYRHTTVVVLWPRQTGKTTALWLLMMGRMMQLPDYRCAYTAQTGHITSLKFMEWQDLVESKHGWASRWKTRRSAGTERITDLRRHSYLRAFPPLPGKLRSASLDAVILDESQEHTADLGHRLDADVMPTFDTRPRRQFFITGTAGDAYSTYFKHHVQAARDGTPGYLLSEIGTAPPDADPTDPDVWHAYHPGLRAGLTDEHALRMALSTLGEQRFAREYLNQWQTAASRALVDPATWAAVSSPAHAPKPEQVVLGYDTAWDRSASAIVATWLAGDVLHIEVVEHRPGTAWLVDRLVDYHERLRPILAADSASPAKDVTSTLRHRGIDVRELTLGDYSASCAEMLSRIRDRRLAAVTDPALDHAVRVAVRRHVGDRWVWDRRTEHDVSPLTAATAGAFVASRPTREPVLA